MKVLIVDDNVAVQEIMKDILVGAGHETEVASSVDEAFERMEKFEPDVILLDTWVGDSYGVSVINRFQDEHPEKAVNVILIKSANEQMPTDNQYIKGCIDKPFKSSDVVSVLDKVYADILEANAAGKKKRKPSRILRKKDRTPVEYDGGDIADEGLEFGRSYVMFEQTPSDIYRFVGMFNPSNYKVMIVTTDKVKAIKERFPGADLEIVTMSAGGRADSFDIHGLGTLMTKINGFIKSHAQPVVILDNLTEMAEANGLPPVLVMLHQMISDRTAEKVTFAVSVNPGILTDKDRGIILHDMIQYGF